MTKEEPTITNLQPFGARICNVNLTSAKHREILRTQIYSNGYVLLPSGTNTKDGPRFDETSSISSVARLLGEVQSAHPINEADGHGVQDIVSKGDSGKGQTAALAHNDGTWKVSSFACVVLSPAILPTHGGSTILYDTNDMYNRLSPATKQKLDGLYAVFSFGATYDRFGSKISLRSVFSDSTTTVHPAVIAHPVTGRPHLFLNPSNVVRFVGLSSEEGAELLDDVIREAFDGCHEVKVEWNVGDVLAFDNLALQHKAMDDYTELRVMRRALSGDVTFRTSIYVDDVYNGGKEKTHDFAQLMYEYKTSLSHGVALENAFHKLHPSVVSRFVNEHIARNEDVHSTGKHVRILDVGASTGMNGLMFLKMGVSAAVHLTYLDRQGNLMMEAQRRQLYDEYVELDIHKDWPFRLGEFNAVLCTTALLRPKVQLKETVAQMCRAVCCGGFMLLVLWSSESAATEALLQEEKMSIVERKVCKGSDGNEQDGVCILTAWKEEW